jgi:hypothetical protein
MQHAFGGVAQQETFDQRPAVIANHDQIRVPFSSGSRDFVGRQPLAKNQIAGNILSALAREAKEIVCTVLDVSDCFGVNESELVGRDHRTGKYMHKREPRAELSGESVRHIGGRFRRLTVVYRHQDPFE